MGNYSPQRLLVDDTTKLFDGYAVTLTTDPKTLSAGTMAMLSFAISKDGTSVADPQPYLAALGHSVIIREGSLDYIHAHAIETPTIEQNGTINFHTEFPRSGLYKVFTQFKHQDRVITADFSISVAEAAQQPR